MAVAREGWATKFARQFNTYSLRNTLQRDEAPMGYE